MSHRNAPLTSTGRARLVSLIIDHGWSQRRAAERLNVSPATANRWVTRHRAGESLGDRAAEGQSGQVEGRHPQCVEGREQVGGDVGNGVARGVVGGDRGASVTGVVDGDDAGVGGQGVHLRQPHVGGRADGAGEDDDGGVGAAGAGPDGHGECRIMVSSLHGTVDDGGEALATADAHGGQTQVTAGAGELVAQGHEQAGTGGTDRVPQGDTGAGRVEAGI